MISIDTSSSNTVKMTDPSVVVSMSSLGLSNLGTGLSGIPAVRPASSVSLAGLPIRERNERPIQALEAAVVAGAHAYAFAAAGAGSLKQTKHHHTMWAFRGPEPWSDPA